MLSRTKREKHRITEDQLVRTPLVVKGVALLVLIFIIPLEGLIKEGLMSWGGSVVYNIQKTRSESSDSFFQYLSYIANNLFLIVVAPALYNFYDPRRAVKLILIWCFSMYCSSVISLIYREPRPYWVDDDIRGVNCQNGFALPSSECMLGTVVYVSLSIEFFQKKIPWVKALIYSGTISVLGLLGYGGLYLGENFPHQIFISYCYGYVFITICFAFDKKLLNFSIRSCFNYKINKKYSVYWYMGTMFLLLAIISIYDLVTLTKDIDIKWIENVTQHCHLKYDVGGSTSFYRSA